MIEGFARICVEINLDNQLPSHIIISGEELVLEYEGLHAICIICEKYGHKKDQCSEFMGNDNSTTPDNKPATAANGTNATDAGVAN